MKGKIFFLVLAMVMVPFFHGEAKDEKTKWQPELAVNLFSGIDAVNFHASELSVLATSDGKWRKKFAAGVPVSVSAAGKKFRVGDEEIDGGILEFRPQDAHRIANMTVTVGGKTYRGCLRLTLGKKGVMVSNILPTDDYLLGVVPEEMPASWHKEALKAQAVAARTFALKNRGKHKAEGFDLCNTTHCQVYLGLAAELKESSEAVKATHGEVLVYGPHLIDASFHTDSGGMTESSKEVWGMNSPYLRAERELKTGTLPWQKEISLKEFSQKFFINDVKKVELSPLHIGQSAKDRTESGRVKYIRIKTEKGERTILGSDLKNVFGLRSTLFDLSLKNGSLFFKGYGWGHGVGMSQWGAKAFAEAGKKYTEILAHYYHGTKLKKLY